MACDIFEADPEFSANWIPIGIEYPPEDKPVLVSDGESIQIRILKLDGKFKYWLSDSFKEVVQVRFWMPLPDKPEDE